MEERRIYLDREKNLDAPVRSSAFKKEKPKPGLGEKLRRRGDDHSEFKERTKKPN